MASRASRPTRSDFNRPDSRRRGGDGLGSDGLGGDGLGQQCVHQTGQRPVLGTALEHERAGGHPRVHPVRSTGGAGEQPRGAEAQARKRRKPAGVPIQLGEVGQRDERGAALMRENRVYLDTAAQRRAHDAAGAGTHDHVDIAQPPVEPLLHGVQRTGHPGGAKHPARTKYQPHAGTPDPARLCGEHHRGLRSLELLP